MKEAELQFWRAKLAIATEQLGKTREETELQFWAQRWWWCLRQIYLLY